MKKIKEILSKPVVKYSFSVLAIAGLTAIYYLNTNKGIIKHLDLNRDMSKVTISQRMLVSLLERPKKSIPLATFQNCLDVLHMYFQIDKILVDSENQPENLKSEQAFVSYMISNAGVQTKTKLNLQDIEFFKGKAFQYKKHFNSLVKGGDKTAEFQAVKDEYIKTKNKFYGQVFEAIEQGINKGSINDEE